MEQGTMLVFALVIISIILVVSIIQTKVFGETGEGVGGYTELKRACFDIVKEDGCKNFKEYWNGNKYNIKSLCEGRGYNAETCKEECGCQ